jgi:excisionase family DNA binding protein
MSGKTQIDFDPRQKYARRIDLAARPGEEPSAQCLAEALGKILSKLDEIQEVLAGARKSHLTVEEVARLVGRSAYTVRRWISEHRINANRVADTGPRGRLLIAREEVARLIAEGKGGRVAFQLDDPSR